MSAQMTLDFARRQRDRGMGLAEMGAINACEKWPDLALEFLKLYALRTKEPFTAEQVLEAADAQGLIRPPNPKAWGPTFRRAAGCGIIEKAGVGVCRKRHASVCLLWSSKVSLR